MKDRPRRVAYFICMFAFAQATVNGCSVAPELQTAADIATEEFGAPQPWVPLQAAVGRWLFGPASVAVYPFHHEAGSYLASVGRVEARVIPLAQAGQTEGTGFAGRVRAALAEQGLVPIVFVDKPGQMVGIFGRNLETVPQDLFVVFRDRQQVVLGRVRVHLEQLLTTILMHHRQELRLQRRDG